MEFSFKTNAPTQAATPLLSVIIPVFREESTINEFLNRLLMVFPQIPFELILVDGERPAHTLAALNPSLKADPRVKTATSPKGRALQMNLGAEMANGDLLLFLHADTTIDRKAILRMLSISASDTYVGGAFDLAIQSPRFSLKLIARVASIRSRMTRIPYGDQAVFLKRSCFLALEGFAPIPLMEDVDIMRRIKKRGWRIRIFSVRVVTSGRRWEKEGALFGTLRNWSLMTLYLLGVPPEKLAGYYRFRTVSRN